MNNEKNKIIRFMIIIVIILIALDQISKILIINKNPVIGEDKIIGIKQIQNTGMAFSFSEGNTKNIILTVIILLLIVNFVRNQKERIDKKTGVAISLILAGGVSNLIDRITRGGIVDFIKIKNFAIFNLADCYVVIGWFLLVIFLIKFNKEIVGGKDCEKK